MKQITFKNLTARLLAICTAKNMQIEDIWVRYCLKDRSDIIIFYIASDGQMTNFSITIFEEEFNLQLIEAKLNLEIAKIQKNDTSNFELTIESK